MTQNRFTRAKEVFLAACSITANDRPKLLDQECGEDLELRAEVERLLTHHGGEVSDSRTMDSGEVRDRPRRAPSQKRFKAGDVFAERYRIIDELGSGGMGVVYRAHDLLIDEPVALKFLHALSRSRSDGLLNEVRLARQVSHNSVCRVFDVAEQGDEIYLSMEYVDGEDLASLLKRIGHLPPDKLVDVARQLTAGVAAAHARGVLHRDLKPGNVMIDREGRVKITDFGIATVSAEDDTGMVVGTPAYMAPEQLDGKAASEQSDLYSLGLVLHEAATGHRVFRGGSLVELAEARRTSQPAPLAQVAPTLPSGLSSAIDRCLAEEAGRRPSSALAVAASLPGADPISLALDVGQTPSPEDVAAARDPNGASPIRGMLPVVILLALLSAAMLLADHASRAANPDLIKPPDVLADRADQLLRSLGYPQPADRAWGFLPCCDQATGATAHLFWYRESPSYLIPDSAWSLALGSGRIDLLDPAPLESGMVQLILDSTGTLILLDAVPEERTLPAKLPSEHSIDWQPVLGAAGYDENQLERTEPRIVPYTFADELAAWTASGDAGSVTHIDAAALGGRVVFFDADPDKIERAADSASIEKQAATTGLILDLFLITIVIAAAVLGRTSIRQGRGDPLGARRLAAAVVMARLLYWLLAADHAPLLESELTALELTLGAALLEGLFVWLAYMALEPLVRRSWPRTLVAWSRLLRGHGRDSAVGRSLMIGAAAGALWAVIGQLDLVLTTAFGFELGPLVDQSFPLDMALNGRLPIANTVFYAVQALEGGIAALFALAVLHLGLGRRTWSISIFFVGLAVMRCLDGANPAVSWALLGLVVAGTGTLLLVRFGLLAYVVARFSEELILSSPLTLDLEVWFAASGLFAVITVALVGGLGWQLAGRSKSG